MIWRTDLGGWAAAVLAIADRAMLADGIPPLSGHVLDALGVGSDEYLLAPAVGPPKAFGVAHAGDPAEFVVDPAARDQGLGRALLTAALDRSGAVWAHGDLPPARALAVEFGLRRTRELLQMRRAVDPGWTARQVAAAPFPAGVMLRTFVPGRDEDQFLGVNARAFHWHPEQGRLDLAGLELEMAQPWFDPAGFFLAVDQHDTVLGFHWTKIHPNEGRTAATGNTGLDTTRSDTIDTAESASIGEVYVLGVDPLARLDGRPVRGLGAPLTAAGLHHLATKGLRTVLLYVEGDNDTALKLYRRLGFTTYTTDVVYRRPL